MSLEIIVEREERGELGLRLRDDLQGRLGDDAQCSLMPHEQLLEVIPRRGLPDLLTAAVADPDDLTGRQHDLERDRQVAGVSESGTQQRESAACDPPADQRTGIGRRRIGMEHTVFAQLFVELHHADSGSDRDATVGQIDLLDLVHALDVDDDPAAQRDRAVVEPGATRPRHHRDARTVGEFQDLRHLLCGAGQNHCGGDVFAPAMHGEGSRNPSSIGATRQVRQHRARLIHDRFEVRDDGVV